MRSGHKIPGAAASAAKLRSRPCASPSFPSAAKTVFMCGRLAARGWLLLLHSTVTDAKEEEDLRPARCRRGVLFCTRLARLKSDDLCHGGGLVRHSRNGERIPVSRLGRGEG